MLRALADCVRDRLKGKEQEGGMAKKIASLRNPWLAEWHAKLNSAEVPMTPYSVINELMRVVNPADAIVTHTGQPSSRKRNDCSRLSVW